MKPLLSIVVCFVCCIFLLFENQKQLSTDHLKKPVHSSFFHIEDSNLVDEDMKEDIIGFDKNSLMKNEENIKSSSDNKLNPSIGDYIHQKEISFNEILSGDESVSKGDGNDKNQSDSEELQVIKQENKLNKEEEDEKSDEMENELVEHGEMEKEFVDQKEKEEEEEEKKEEMKEEKKKKEEEKEEKEDKTNEEEEEEEEDKTNEEEKEEKEEKMEEKEEMKEEEEKIEEKEEEEKMEDEKENNTNEEEEEDKTNEEEEMEKMEKEKQNKQNKQNNQEEKQEQTQSWNTLQHQTILSHTSLSNNCSTLYWNCSSFYMNLGTLYSLFNTQPLIQSNYQSLQVQSTYPLLTSSLKEESERKLEFSFDDSWKQRFETLQQEVYSNYLSTYDSLLSVYTHSNTTKYDDTLKSSYSHIVVKKALDSQSGWILATNICFEKKSKQYHIYSINGKPINIRKHGKQFFRFGWHFNFHKGRIPENVAWYDDKTVYLAMQFRPKHITHFAESINLLLLKLMAPSEFPPISSLILPIFRDFDEYGWSKTYLKLVMNSFPQVQENITVLKQDQLFALMRKKSARMICFPSAVLMDRMAYNNDGGIFAGFFSADWMRAISYKYATIPAINKQQKFELGILERHTDRKWINLPLYLKHLHKHFDSKVNIHRIEMFGMTYADQVKEFYTDDIILGGHGSAMANVFFMRPRSVLIECNPPYFYEMCFANIAYISRVHYISVTNYNATKTDFTFKKVNRLYQKGTFFRYRRQFARYNIYPSVLSVVSAVSDAVDFVEYSRCTFIDNDVWSRVFIQ